MTGLVLVDLSAAYDTVNHRKLLYKVLNFTNHINITEPMTNQKLRECVDRFIYADDLGIAAQENNFRLVEERLTKALSELTPYYEENYTESM